ncbi:MAG: tetratricopeptide repeat protein [Candidatus Coatesbacteria bacterium]|nr:MAG: tetratricopeptide repeat protein [Candidatus Coatesbacteria bacterium]
MSRATVNIGLAIVITFITAISAQADELYRPTLVFQPFTDKTEGVEEYVPPPPGAGGVVDVKAPMPWLSTGIPEMLYFMLERTYAVNLVSSSDIRADLKKHGVELGPETPITVLTETASREGADYVVSGEYSKTEDTINISVTVYGLSGIAAGSADASGDIEDIFAVEEETAKAILGAVGVLFDGKILLQDPTGSLEAYKWFSEGSAKYYTGERIAMFDRALAVDADFVELHLKIAEANRLEGAYETAKLSYETARGLADVYPEAPAYLGFITTKLDPTATSDAFAYYEEALAMDPAFAPAVGQIGYLYYKQEDYKTAAKYFDELIEIQPGNATGYYHKGNVLWITGSTSASWQTVYRDAIREYDVAVEKDPEFAEAYYNRGSIYKAFEDKTNAAADYIQYLRLKPNSPYKEDLIETLKLWGVSIPGDIDPGE